MTELDRDTVLLVAKLARLELTDEEVEYYQQQLSRVVDYFSQIDEAEDSLDLNWRFDTQGSSLPERSDDVFKDEIIKDVLGSAPKTVGTAFQVPKIIE